MRLVIDNTNTNSQAASSRPADKAGEVTPPASPAPHHTWTPWLVHSEWHDLSKYEVPLS